MISDTFRASEPIGSAIRNYSFSIEDFVDSELRFRNCAIQFPIATWVEMIAKSTKMPILVCRSEFVTDKHRWLAQLTNTMGVRNNVEDTVDFWSQRMGMSFKELHLGPWSSFNWFIFQRNTNRSLGFMFY